MPLSQDTGLSVTETPGGFVIDQANHNKSYERRPARRRQRTRDPVGAQMHQVGGSVRQGWDFTRTEQHRDPPSVNPLCSCARTPALRMSPCDRVVQLCVFSSAGFFFVGAGRHFTGHGL